MIVFELRTLSGETLGTVSRTGNERYLTGRRYPPFEQLSEIGLYDPVAVSCEDARVLAAELRSIADELSAPERLHVLDIVDLLGRCTATPGTWVAVLPLR